VRPAARRPWIQIAVTLAVAIAAAPATAAPADAETFDVPGSTGQPGITLRSQSPSGLDLHFELGSYTAVPVDVEGEVLTKIAMPGVFLPNDAGAPDLPGLGRFIAVPEGATARVEIVRAVTRTVSGVDLAPAPVIPRENDDSPLRYERDPVLFGQDAFYPAAPVIVSEPGEMRGVDVVMLGLTPFQWNPVTKELQVYTELELRVDFVGGSGQFGEERLRSRYWDPILAANLVNAGSLPAVDFARRDAERAAGDRNGWEYIIITPDDPDFIAWGDTLKAWRKLEGISTECFTTTEIGGTSAAVIEAFLNDAYQTWDPAPAAFLLLGDYPSSGDRDSGITAPVWDGYCVSDNMLADVNGDDLPDMVHGRITARNAAELETMIGKMLDYERTPYTDPAFYDHPVIAGGWQTERWFILCTEIVLGHQEQVLGKSPVREYAIYSGTPGTQWSTNSNTWMLLDYFGPSGLGYIPSTPSYLTDWGGNATRINNDLNAGAFMMLHRDHGSESGWGEPSYHTSNLSGLQNDRLPFVFTINCLTGKYNWSNECFTERFHRMSQGALGLIAASEVSYSFVNDTFIFGLFDGMWPDFMPTYGPHPPESRFTTDLRPAFGMANGKHFLAASNWPYNAQSKDVTYHLFHHHGDAFLTMYSEVPEPLTVTHDPVLPVGTDVFTVQADAGAVIALTVNGEIIGVADATGAPQAIPIAAQTEPGEMLVTVTLANHYRYSEPVLVIYPVTYTIEPPVVPINVTTPVTVTVWDDGGAPLSDVEITLDGWGIAPETDVTDATGQVHLTVMPPYGESLTLVGRLSGESYDCIDTTLPVTGGLSWVEADIEATVPELGLVGALAPHYEGILTGTATQSGFTLMARGCGVEAEASSGGTTSVELPVTPDHTGTVEAALAKTGFALQLEEFAVETFYGTLAGTVTETGGTTPVDGAHLIGYPAGADTTGTPPLFAATTAGDGTYAIEGDLEVDYYDVYVSRFGYLTLHEEVLVQVGPTTADFELADAPTAMVSGTVTDASSGTALAASIKVFRDDTGELYSQTTSDPGAGGHYEVALPYFSYSITAAAHFHSPLTLAVTVDEPAEQVDFALQPSLASILVLDDDEGDGDGPGAPDTGAAADIAADLVALGYDVTGETTATTDPQSWIYYDFLISTSGNDTSPLSSADYRAALEAYVAGGGRLLIEGGDIGHDAAYDPGYPSFAANVLHILDWEYELSGTITVHDPAHPLATVPNQLGMIASQYSGTGDQDACTPAPDAHVVMSWSLRPGRASVLVYDDDPDPATCQIIYYAFNYASANEDGRKDLLENSVACLLGGGTTAVEGPVTAGAVPARHVLGRPTPNPFNPVTRLTYGLPGDGAVELAIYNVAGQRVRILAAGLQTAGYHEIAWDGRDDGGRPLASGIYFCRMRAGDFDRSTRLVLLK
jgi:hypothetical protein